MSGLPETGQHIHANLSSIVPCTETGSAAPSTVAPRTQCELWRTPQSRAASCLSWTPGPPYLHSEVEHQTVRMGLSQLIKQISPCGVCDHLLKPSWGLTKTKDKAKDLALDSQSVLRK